MSAGSSQTIAVLAAAAAVGVGLRPLTVFVVGPVAGRRADGEQPGWWPPGRSRLIGVGAPVLVVLVTLSAGVGLWLALLASGAALALVRGRRRSTAERSRRLQEQRAVEACGVLVDELRSGRPPGLALDAAAEVDALLRSVCRVAQHGGDVPEALRGTGVQGYAVVAAAWRVAEQHGVALAESVRRVLTHLRADLATDRVVAAELASARSTARLLLALPVFALLAGAATGGRPWEFLLSTTWGAGCLVLGVTLSWAGLRWIDALAAGVRAQ